MWRPIILASLFVLGVLSAGQAQSERRFPHSEITKAEWQTYLSEVRAKPGVEAFVPQGRPDTTAFYAPGDQAVYYFTKGGPAYPAVVVVRVSEHAGKTRLQNFGYFAGSEVAFATWFNSFKSLGPEIQERLKRKPS